MVQAGIDQETAEEMMRLKLRFAFGQIRPSEKLLEGKIIAEVRRKSVMELKYHVWQ